MLASFFVSGKFEDSLQPNSFSLFLPALKLTSAAKVLLTKQISVEIEQAVWMQISAGYIWNIFMWQHFYDCFLFPGDVTIPTDLFTKELQNPYFKRQVLC